MCDGHEAPSTATPPTRAREESDCAATLFSARAWLACMLTVGATATAIGAFGVRMEERPAPTKSSALRRVEVPEYRVDIDRADVAELALLPEIGPGLAARIAADRAVRGVVGA
ncbi:MAG: hypothetical protein ACKO3W_04000, partial [bacterium]